MVSRFENDEEENIDIAGAYLFVKEILIKQNQHLV
jgi:hypothetical protein